MKTLRNLSLLLLALIAVSLGFSSPVFGDATMTQAHELLHQAIDNGMGTPSIDDRTRFLKQARDVLANDPSRHYGGHRKAAIRMIDSALAELGKGDPDKKAEGYIRDADKEVRTVE